MPTITAPDAARLKGELVTYYGPTEVTFIDGTATVDDLSDALRVYLLSNGYTIDGETVDQPEAPERVDARDVDRVRVGTPLRDAAVNPAATDFLPPVGAGEGDPHGPTVVAPGIHAEGARPVRAGAVRSDPDAQSDDERAFAERVLIGGEPLDAPSGADWKDGTGPLGLSDPLSVADGKGLGDAALEEPKGNASREAWVAYAAAQGASGDDVDGLSRDDLRAKYGS